MRERPLRVVRWPVLIAPLLWIGWGCTVSEPLRVQTFPIPRQIVASVAPYASVEQALADADNVDWDHDFERARAVTVAYAAQELRHHLLLAGISPSIVSPEVRRTRSGITLVVLTPSIGQRPLNSDDLAVDPASLGEQGYAIVPDHGRVVVMANTRVGLLYGAYALLEQLGYRWYDPYDTRIPDPAALARPVAWRRLEEVPRVPLRGFWIYGDRPTPDEFAVWVARNKLNLGGRPRLPLQRMLGIEGWGGGHQLLQEEFSRDGLFEAHPDWFAEVEGVRRPVSATGEYFNPSFASAGAAAYFADRMVQRLERGDLVGVDVLNVWPTDSPLNLFDQSAAARALGNETDNLLAFYADVCAALRHARAEGRLSRPVTVAGISYYLTMTPPTNPSVVAALQREQYLHLFYPIDRDWSGPFNVGLGDRDSNRAILQKMSAWSSQAKLRYGVVEYHNMSAYGAVALTDHLNLALNYAILSEGRSELYGYMHPLLHNPGPRRLTNLLQAKLAWRDTSADECEATLAECETALARRAAIAANDYFIHRYGKLASEMRAIYDLMARSVENSRELFFSDSLSWVLLQQLIWSSPPYTPGEAVGFIGRYRTGGVQSLPAAFLGRVTERATFRGLDESIALQVQARRRWRTLLARPMDGATRQRIESDVTWFETTASRYRLLAASADLAISRYEGRDESAARARIATELAILEGSPVIRDTISPIDQSYFLTLHRQLANLP